MTNISPTSKQRKLIDALVQHYKAKENFLNAFMESLRDSITSNSELMRQIHSLKWRLKDPGHLRDKLMRKASDARTAGKDFDFTRDNLFERITDIVGIRILHLHTSQFPTIHDTLMRMLRDQNFPLFEKPFVRSWDDETKEFFKSHGLSIQKSPTLYTSVHYVVRINRREPYTGEIQVRTLAEELWGEVDHSINYPYKTPSVACGEQIKALARLTSGCTRLVDSIFRSADEFQSFRV